VSGARLARAALAATLAGLLLALLLLPRPWTLPGGAGFFAAEGDALHHVVKRALVGLRAGGAAVRGAARDGARLDGARGYRAAPAAPPALARAVPARRGRARRRAALRARDRERLVGRGLAGAAHRRGQYRPPPAPDGPAPRFVAVPWIRTFFDYEAHQPPAAERGLARLGGPLARSARRRARELRRAGAAPADLRHVARHDRPAGALGGGLGLPRAGAATAFLLALHPWHIETATGRAASPSWASPPRPAPSR
jgi:hypothetical protein